MSQLIEIKVPDIGDFNDIPVIEICVKVGDTVNLDDALVTLESDKATMDVPSSASGIIREIRVALGDRLSEGTVVAVIEASEAKEVQSVAPVAPAPQPSSQAPQASAPVASSASRPATAALPIPQAPLPEHR